MSDFAKTVWLAIVLTLIAVAALGWTSNRERECEAAGGVLVRGVLFALECVQPAKGEK